MTEKQVYEENIFNKAIKNELIYYFENIDNPKIVDLKARELKDNEIDLIVEHILDDTQFNEELFNCIKYYTYKYLKEGNDRL